MKTNYRRPIDADSLANNFRVFAEAECANEPLYEALSNAIADNVGAVTLLMQAPYPQRRPVLLFAAVHDLLLAGRSHPLTNFYRTVAPIDRLRVDVDRAADLFFDFCATHREPLLLLLLSRSVQTNEIGRSAALRLALSTLDAREPIALIDVGCSGGLNLLVDRYRFELHMPDGSTRSEGPTSDVVVPTSITAGDPDANGPRSIPPIAMRFGIDLSPLDVHDARDARWLQACVWPSDADRHARLAAALALARTSTFDIRRGDANEQLIDVLAAIDRNVRPVVFHSWVLSYFEREARQRFSDAVRAMIVERDGAWISAEGPRVIAGLDPPVLADDADPARREATLWHVTTRDAGSANAPTTKTRVVARSHPHCRWIEWLADPSSSVR
jgi:hypothetical protein